MAADAHRAVVARGQREVFFDDTQLEVCGKPGAVSDQLLPMIERNRSLWKGQAAHFDADSGNSAGK